MRKGSEVGASEVEKEGALGRSTGDPLFVRTGNCLDNCQGDT